MATPTFGGGGVRADTQVLRGHVRRHQFVADFVNSQTGSTALRHGPCPIYRPTLLSKQPSGGLSIAKARKPRMHLDSGRSIRGGELSAVPTLEGLRDGPSKGRGSVRRARAPTEPKDLVRPRGLKRRSPRQGRRRRTTSRSLSSRMPVWTSTSRAPVFKRRTRSWPPGTPEKSTAPAPGARRCNTC